MKVVTIAFFLLGLFGLPLAAQEPCDSLLAARIDSLVDNHLPKGSDVGISVVLPLR